MPLKSTTLHWKRILGDKQYSTPAHHQEQLLKFILMISMFTLAVFIPINWVIHFHTLAMIQAFTFALFVPLLFSCCIHHIIPQRLIEQVILWTGIVIFNSLIIFGSYANTGIYWVAIFPFLIFLLVGLYRGWRWMALFIGIGISIHILLDFYDFKTAYNQAELSICIASIVFYSLIAAVFQMIRERYQHELKLANQNLERAVQARTQDLSAEIKLHKKTNQALQKKEQQFQQAQKMDAIGTLVGGIAHDFNNMLSGINANLFMIKRYHQEDQATLKRTDNIEALVFHASAMIQQLLTFARKDSIEFNSFNAIDFFKQAYNLAKVSIAEHIKLTFSAPNHHFYIQANRTQLQQVVINLINNARDALHHIENPEIAITVSSFQSNKDFSMQHPKLKQQEYICLSIKDNGCGIEKEKIKQIFEPFFTTKDTGKGTGLGLAMCYGAIESHHGCIDVCSKVGVGTEFLIYLPSHTAADLAHQAVQNTQLQTGHGEVILIVDDDESLRLAQCDALQHLGYQTLQAKNGIEAIEVFKQHHQNIQLTIMDVMMPKMGGVQAALHIHNIQADAMIIFITGYDKDKTLDGRQPMDQEHQILEKPITIEVLSKTIHQHLNNKANPPT